jgi:hypothetical protein
LSSRICAPLDTCRWSTDGMVNHSRDSQIAERRVAARKRRVNRGKNGCRAEIQNESRKEWLNWGRTFQGSRGQREVKWQAGRTIEIDVKVVLNINVNLVLIPVSVYMKIHIHISLTVHNS